MSLGQEPTAYAELGWPTEVRDGHVELITGSVIDALEVPRAAGLLAASWWRYSEGHPDEVRRLPSLPDPSQALALITAGDRHFFLAQAGECPWQAQDPVTTAAAASAGAVIRWHSQGSRIPVPPGPVYARHAGRSEPASGQRAGQPTSGQPDRDRASGGRITADRDGRAQAGRGPGSGGEAAREPVSWIHLPDRGIRLPGPAVLLHLLATAVALTRLGPHLLALDGGVLAVPVLGEPPVFPAGSPAALPGSPAVRLGFGVGHPG
jgi:hypothetical protein